MLYNIIFLELSMSFSILYDYKIKKKKNIRHSLHLIIQNLIIVSQKSKMSYSKCCFLKY